MTHRYRRTARRLWQFKPIDRNDRARIMHLAERLNTNTRQPGQHGGCLKDSGLQVLRALLFGFLNCRTGRLDPSIDTIARHVGHSRQTIVSALQRLRAAGFISWVQRVVMVDVDGQLRPRQTSNAYVVGTGLQAAGFMPSGCATAGRARARVRAAARIRRMKSPRMTSASWPAGVALVGQAGAWISGKKCYLNSPKALKRKENFTLTVMQCHVVDLPSLFRGR